MKNESLDDLIDRVASEMTTVPADHAFTGRLAARLDGRTRPTRPAARWLALALPAMAVLLWAVLVPMPGEKVEVASAVEPQLGARAVDQPLAPFAATPSPIGAAAGAAGAGRRAAFQFAAAPETGAEDLSSGPPPLAVAALTIESVELPAMADIVPLDVPALEIPEIAPDEPVKEP